MKTRLACVVLFTSSFWLTGAFAASFDCGKARTGVEKAICGDAALGRLDEAIDREYRSLLDKVEPRFRTKVVDAQRIWLKSRPGAYDLRKALQSRLEDLKNALVTANGVALLRLSGNALPPYVVTPLPGAAAYNRAVDDIVDASRTDHTFDAEMAECSRLSDATGSRDPAPKVAKKLEECESMSSTSRSYTIDFVSPDLLSIEESVSEYTWRAAHPSNSDSHLNWWLSKAGKVGPNDMFATPAYRRVLAAGVRRHLKKVEAVADDDIVAGAADPDHWGWTADHLRITGQGYDYGIGRGYVEIEIPWAEFGPAAKPQFVGLLKKGGRVTDPRLNPAAGKR